MFDLIIAALDELTVASRGGDWGYGALAQLLGDSELARSIVNALAQRK